MSLALKYFMHVSCSLNNVSVFDTQVEKYLEEGLFSNFCELFKAYCSFTLTS